MADQGRLLVEPADDLGVAVRDLSYRLVRENLGVGVRLFDGVRITRPARANRRVPGLFEERCPAVPAAGQQPQTVDENDRREPRRVGAFELLIDSRGSRRNRHALLLSGPPPATTLWGSSHA